MYHINADADSLRTDHIAIHM